MAKPLGTEQSRYFAFSFFGGSENTHAKTFARQGNGSKLGMRGSTWGGSLLTKQLQFSAYGVGMWDGRGLVLLGFLIL